MFNALTQTLFQDMTQSAAGASLEMGKLTEQASRVHTRGSSGLTKRDEIVIKDIPIDIRTIHRIFDLDPKATIFAACTQTKCCAIYHPTLDPATGIAQYPLLCNNQLFGSVCASPLVGYHVTDGQSVPYPLRPFPYRHFNDHVAAMLAQPGIEDNIRAHLHSGASKEELHDIISAPQLAKLRDPSGLPFLRDCDTELRLVWTLCADWYNPYMNKAAGKSVSSGVVAMVCLSLPPHLRLREENIFYYPFPGPQEPHADAMDHLMDPLVFDLQAAYDPGVFFSYTHSYPSGRTSRSAIIPVVADTMASKKLTGHCGHAGKYFCSRCRLPHSEIHNVDMATWPPGLTRSEHAILAEKWRDASTKRQRDRFLRAGGVRWSPLLRLSYWLPSDWTVIEGVHTTLLGGVPRHCKDLLGLKVNELLDEEEQVNPEDIDPKLMLRARKKLAIGEKGPLRSLSMTVLKALCVEQDICVPPPTRRGRKKEEYITALLVCAFPSDQPLPHQHYRGFRVPRTWRSRIRRPLAQNDTLNMILPVSSITRSAMYQLLLPHRPLPTTVPDRPSRFPSSPNKC